jgi:hypothetical protein
MTRLPCTLVDSLFGSPRICGEEIRVRIRTINSVFRSDYGRTSFLSILWLQGSRAHLDRSIQPQTKAVPSGIGHHVSRAARCSIIPKSFCRVRLFLPPTKYPFRTASSGPVLTFGNSMFSIPYNVCFNQMRNSCDGFDIRIKLDDGQSHCL